jgi:hypothetical protein
MKLIISEKQLQQLVKLHAKSQELSEEGEEGAPEAGTSSDGEKKTGMPKWESGINRGPANQIAVTRWKDIDGTTPARGKANTLWEQNLLGPKISPVDVNNALNPNTDTPTKEYTTFWGSKIMLPDDGSVSVKTWSDDKPRALVFKGAFEDPDMPGYIFWPQKYLDPKSKKTYTKDELAPDEDWLSVKFPTGTIRYINTKKDNRIYGPVLTKTSTTGDWKLNNNYFYNPGGGGKYIPFNPEKYVHISMTTKTWEWLKENWVTIAEVVVSIAAGILSGGATLLVQALVQAGVTIVFAGSVYAMSDMKTVDTIGFATGVMIGCLPFISAATKLGVKGPLKSLAKFGDELILAKNNDEVLNVINKFDEADKILVTRCLKQIPKSEFEKVIANKALQGFAKEVRSGKINITKIPGAQLKWWKDLLVEGGGALPISVAGFYYKSIEERKEAETELIKLLNTPTPTNNKNITVQQTKDNIDTNTPNQKQNSVSDDPFGLKK